MALSSRARAFISRISASGSIAPLTPQEVQTAEKLRRQGLVAVRAGDGPTRYVLTPTGESEITVGRGRQVSPNTGNLDDV